MFLAVESLLVFPIVIFSQSISRALGSLLARRIAEKNGAVTTRTIRFESGSLQPATLCTAMQMYPPKEARPIDLILGRRNALRFS